MYVVSKKVCAAASLDNNSGFRMGDRGGAFRMGVDLEAMI